MSDEDIWSRWLLKNRFGGNVELGKKVLEKQLYPVRDQVLSHTGLPSGGTLLDAGCGDGLIAFGALEKFPECRVIFADISAPLLEQSRQIAEQMGLQARCRFVQSPAEDLSVIPDESVDAVTTRSVLIYIKPKQQAFNEFYRVLKPGGWTSLYEPINRFSWPPPEGFFGGYDVRPVADLALKVEAIYASLQPPDDPMLDFDERDLIAYAEQAGFSEIHMELHSDIQPAPDSMPWENFWKYAPNPKVPTIEEAIRQALSPEEIERFVSVLRPLVETNQSTMRLAVAYLWAQKRTPKK